MLSTACLSSQDSSTAQWAATSPAPGGYLSSASLDPPRSWTILLAALAYGNFFTHHFGPDLRWGLITASALLFGRCWIEFRTGLRTRRMPLLGGLFLVTLFIWIAENAGTYDNAWIYPSQENGWHMVGFGKMSAWYLLMLLSFVLVSLTQSPRYTSH